MPWLREEAARIGGSLGGEIRGLKRENGELRGIVEGLIRNIERTKS